MTHVQVINVADTTAVLAKISDGGIDGNDLVRTFGTIGQIAEESMGGTSGALYSFASCYAFLSLFPLR